MPRGKIIKRSLDEQINILEEDIRIAQNKLNKLQTKWKDLQKQKKEEDMANLYSLIQESGMSLEQVRQVLVEKNRPATCSDPDAPFNAQPDTATEIIDIA